MALKKYIVYASLLVVVGLQWCLPTAHAMVLTPPATNTNPPPPATTVVTEGQIVNPISYNSLGELIVALIRFLLIMVGSLSVLFIIIGAVRMVTSAGNEKAVTAGKQTIQWAVLGLIVALMSFSVIAMVQSLLGRQ